MMRGFTNLLFIAVVVSIASCKAYRQDVLFRLDDENPVGLESVVSNSEGNYVINASDLLQVEVFTNKGERLVDPNFELQAQQGQQGGQIRNQYQYLVQQDGVVKLPIVGDQQITGYTIDETEAILELAYSKFYKDAFVKIQMLNRRVVVLGAGGGSVIPLQNEKTSLMEVLALYGGLEIGAKSDKIRILRGDLNAPQVYFVDLSSIAGMRASMIQIEPGDVIYIEPWRRPWLESLQDLSPIVGLITSAITLIVLIRTL